MRLNGSQIIIECLKEQGVDTVFGYPGSSVLPLYEELFKNQKRIRHILTSHEQGAAHAADGYARVTGRVGVCIATSGPGATNLVTGIATAYMDSVPIVAITGNVASDKLGKDSFQEIDIAGITMPITKQGYIVKRVEVLADTIRKAFRIAAAGRPGPVIVDITNDVFSAKTEYKRAEQSVKSNMPEAVDRSSAELKKAEELKAATELIVSAQKPLILVGGGSNISDTGEELNIFCRLADAPVANTLMGKSAVSELFENHVGMLGAYGSKAAEALLKECDLLIALGVRFSDRMTGSLSDFAPKAKILQIDIDAAELNKNIEVERGIIGDIGQSLAVINTLLEQQSHTEWIARAHSLKKKLSYSIDESVLSGPLIIEHLYRLTKGEALISTEVGLHQMYAAQFYKCSKKRSFFTSGGLGTMGYGLSASIGVKLGSPESLVVNIAGDGCFRMNMNELVTASRHGIPIIQLVFNNQVLGMVYKWQKDFYDGHYYQTELKDKLDFVKLAESLGVKAMRIEKPEDIDMVLMQAIELKEPVVVDCVINSKDNMWPMTPDR